MKFPSPKWSAALICLILLLCEACRATNCGCP